MKGCLLSVTRAKFAKTLALERLAHAAVLLFGARDTSFTLNKSVKIYAHGIFFYTCVAHFCHLSDSLAGLEVSF